MIDSAVVVAEYIIKSYVYLRMNQCTWKITFSVAVWLCCAQILAPYKKIRNLRSFSLNNVQTLRNLNSRVCAPLWNWIVMHLVTLLILQLPDMFLYMIILDALNIISCLDFPPNFASNIKRI